MSIQFLEYVYICTGFSLAFVAFFHGSYLQLIHKCKDQLLYEVRKPTHY